MEAPNLQLNAEFEKINYNTPLIQAIQSVVMSDSKSNYFEKSFPMKTVAKISQLLSTISPKQGSNLPDSNNISKSNNMNDNSLNTSDLLGPKELFMNIYKKNSELQKKPQNLNATPLDTAKGYIDMNWELMTDRWFQDNKIYMPCNKKFENLDEPISISTPQIILPHANPNLAYDKAISMTQIPWNRTASEAEKKTQKITNIILSNGMAQPSKGNKVSTIIAPGDVVKANPNITLSSSSQNKGGLVANFGTKIVHISQEVIKQLGERNEEPSQLVQTDKPLNAQNIDLIKTEDETQEFLKKNKADNKREKKKKDKLVKEKKKTKQNSEANEEKVEENVKENKELQPPAP